MLTHLHIENIAVIARVDIEFSSGLNVLTGETGAGKSIIIDAINAVLGERTSRSIVRTGAERARVDGLFIALPEDVLKNLADLGIYPDEDGNLLISRELTADGKNVCRINGLPATIGMLRAAAPFLVAIHGQHDSQRLLNSSLHIELLNRYGGYAKVIAEYSDKFKEYLRLSKRLNELNMDESEKARRLDMLRYQIDELTNADLTEGEEEELLARKSLLTNAERVASDGNAAYNLLYGGEDGEGACTLLDLAASALSRAGRFDKDYEELASKAADLQSLSEEIAHDILRKLSDLEFEPGELDVIEARLDVLYRVKRKYGGSVAAAIEFLQNAEEEYNNIELLDEEKARVTAEIDKVRAEAEALATEMHNQRKSAASRLESAVEIQLSELDMPKTRFVVEFSGLSELGGNGWDTVEFLISANAGEPPRPLNKTASGGELSRIMLAIKNVLKEGDTVYTLIFDEIDAGISGRAAGKVGVKLYETSKDRQVLCVTHLAQIAAMADAHFYIEKTEKDGRTFTGVTPLDEEQRILELARIGGAPQPTDAQRMAALDLLNHSNSIKAGL